MTYNALTGGAVNIEAGTRLATIPLIRHREPATDLIWQTASFCERLAAVVLLAASAPVALASACSRGAVP
jgi:hypothetical protein